MSDADIAPPRQLVASPERRIGENLHRMVETLASNAALTVPGDTCTAHLIAVNCHPFHDLDAVLSGFEPVSEAARVLQRASQDRVEVRVFWHGATPAPAPVRRLSDQLGFSLTEAPHVSNGENLNAQMDWALREGFDFYYRVDGDDRVFAQRFLLQSRHLARGTCDICGGGLRYEPDDGPPYETIPHAAPRLRDFLENRFVLHPSMAIRLSAFRDAGLRYWSGRLEDKALILMADAAGLRIANLPVLLGSYRLHRDTRNRFAAKWLGLRLNLAFLWQRRAFGLMPYALSLFAAQLLLGAHRMRALRHALYRVETRAPSDEIASPLAKRDE